MANDKKKKDKLEQWIAPVSSVPKTVKQTTGSSGVTYTYSQPKQTGGTRIVGTGGGTVSHTPEGAANVARLANQGAKSSPIVNAVSKGVKGRTPTVSEVFVPPMSKKATTGKKTTTVSTGKSSADKETQKANITKQSEELAKMRRERAELRIKNMSSSGGLLGGGMGVGTSGADTAKFAELDRKIKAADEKLQADEADFYGYVKAGDNMYSEADAKIANLPRRLSRTVKGSVQQIGGAAVEAGGQITRAAAEEARYAPGTELEANFGLGEQARQEMRGTAENLFKSSDEIGAKAIETLEEAKGGLGTGGKILVDLGSEGLKLAGDMALNTVAPGTGLAAMGIRAFGSGAQEARLAGATEDQQFLYGVATAGLELATEKLFSSNMLAKKAYGKGWLNSTGLGDALDNGISRIIENPTARLFVTNFIEEGTEEALSDAFSPAIKMIYDREALADAYGTSEGRKQLVKDMLYDGFIGGALGALGATGNVVQQRIVGQRILDNKSAPDKIMQAEAYPVGSATRQMLDPLLEKMNKRVEPTAMEMGRLVHAMQEDFERGYTPDAARVTLDIKYDQYGQLHAQRVMGPVETALYESGMSSEEAFAQGAILRDLALDSNSVSNRQLKDGIDLSDPTVKAMFESLTGETITIPTNASKAQLVKIYRAAAAQHEEKIEAQKRELQAAIDAINDAETALGEAAAQNEQTAQANAQEALEGALAEDLGQTQDESAPTPAPAAPRVQTREEWFAEFVAEFRRDRGRDPSPEDLETAWRWQTNNDGILLDNGQTISREEFYKMRRDAWKPEDTRGVPYTDEDLEAQFQYFRLDSRRAPLPSGEQTNTETAPAQAPEAAQAETSQAPAPVEEGQQMSFEDMDFAIDESERPNQKVVETNPTVNHAQAWTAALLQKKLAAKGIKKVIFDGANMAGEKAHILDGVLYLNENKLTTGKDIWWAVGHEITHPASEADAEMTQKIIDAMQTLNKQGAFNGKGEDASTVRYILNNLEKVVKSKQDAYYKFYVDHGVAEDRAKELSSYEEMLGETANDLMGYVFSNQETIERMIGEEPGIITQAIRTVSRFRSGTDLLRGGVNYSAAAKELDALADRLSSALGNWRDTQAEAKRLDKATKSGYNKSRSPEMEAMIKRLANGEQVPREEVEALPEVAEVLARPLLETINDNSAERQALRQRIIDRIWSSGSYDEASAKKAKDDNAPEVDKYTGPVKQGHRADLILGVPAAGKSSVLVDPISKAHQSRVLDADMAKELLPEFDDGKGAGNVHEESSLIRNAVSRKALRQGDNIVWPMVGDSLDGVKSKVAMLKELGYEVHVHLNELDAHKALGRALARFTGGKPRFVAPKIVTKAGNNPSINYEIIKEEGLIDGYSKYSNDVDKGEPARLIESSDVRRDAQQHDAGADGGVVRWGQGRDQDARGTRGRTEEGEVVNGAELQNYDGSGSDAADRAGAPNLREDGRADQQGLQSEPGAVSEEGRSDQESGRQLPQLTRLVRLSPVSKAKIVDSGVEPVDVSDSTTDYAAFSSALDAAKAADPEHGWAVTPQSEEELAGKNGVTIMAKDGGSGVYVTEDGDIEGVFRNKQTAPKGALRTLLPLAIEAGGRKLDCYGEELAQQYAQAGFIPVAKTEFNPEFANEGWTPDKGKPDIYFMMYVGPTTQGKVLDQYGKYPDLTAEQLDALPMMDYDEAMNLRDQKLAEAQASQSVEGKKFSLVQPVPGLYNKSEQVIATLPAGKIGVGQLMKKLSGSGVNADELKWLGINDFVKGKKSVDRQELLDFIRANDLQIEEEILDSDAIRDVIHWDDGTSTVFRNETYWGRYKTPGGTRYREIMFRLPGSGYYNTASQNHWSDRAPGVIAHARVQNFRDTQGHDILFIDEIQSDWHNAGKKHGYTDAQFTEETKAELEALKRAASETKFNIQSAAGKLQGVLERFMSSRAQDEWFIDNIENAFDSRARFEKVVANNVVNKYLAETLDTAPEAAYKAIVGDNEMYLSSLARDELRTLAYELSEAGRGLIKARRESEAADEKVESFPAPEAPFSNSYTNFALKRLIRDAAEQGLDGIAWTTGQMQVDRWSEKYRQAYENEYDREIPKALNKLGKDFGAQTGWTNLDVKYDLPPVQYFPITDEMRQSVFENGLPKFAIDVPIEEQVEQVLNGRMAGGNYVNYGATTPFMKSIGFRDAPDPTLMSPTKMRIVALPKNPGDNGAHGATREQLARLGYYLEHPVMAIDTMSEAVNTEGRPQKENNVLFLTDMLDEDGLPFILAVRAYGDPSNKQWSGIELGNLSDYMNLVSTVYSVGPMNNQMAAARQRGPDKPGTGQSFTEFIRRAMKSDSILYVDSDGLDRLMKAASDWRSENNAPRRSVIENPANAFTNRNANQGYLDNWVTLPSGFSKVPKDQVIHKSRNLVGDPKVIAAREAKARAKAQAEAKARAAANPYAGMTPVQIAMAKALEAQPTWQAEEDEDVAGEEADVLPKIQQLGAALDDLGVNPAALNISDSSRDTVDDLTYLLEVAAGAHTDPEAYAEESAGLPAELEALDRNLPALMTDLRAAAEPSSAEANLLDALTSNDVRGLVNELRSSARLNPVAAASYSLDTTPPWLSEVLRRERDLSNDSGFQGFMRDFYSGYGSSDSSEPVAPAAPRVSRVRSNTFQSMGVPMQFTGEHKKALEAANYEYDPISEQESMTRAEERLNADYEGEKEKLSKAKAWTGEDLDAAMGILAAELKMARQTGNYDEAEEWTHLIREHGTQGGQLIQSFAKYSRTPEGVIVRATADLEQTNLSEAEKQELLNKITQFAETLNALRPGPNGKMANPNGLVDLIVAQAKQRKTRVSENKLIGGFGSIMKELQHRVDIGQIQYLYDFALTQLDQIAKDYIPASAGKKAATYQTLAHLLNLRTGSRNFVSNTIFGEVAALANDFAMMPDLVLSLMTGQRTVGFDRAHLTKGTWKGMRDRGGKARLEASLDVNPDANAKDKYGTAKRTWKMTGHAGQKVLSTLEKAMAYELNWTDEFRKGVVENEIIRSLAPMVAKGTMTMEQAKAFAEQEMLYRTFQDDTYVNKLLAGVKRVLNTKVTKEYDANGNMHRVVTQADFGLGDIVQKYTQVPGALITRAFEFAPTGYIKAFAGLASLARQTNVAKKAVARAEAAAKKAEGSDKERLKNAAARAFRTAQTEKTKAMSLQREAALSFGRAMTGTGLITLFTILAKAGVLHRDDDDQDADQKALRATEGVSGTQLNYSALQRWATGGDAKWQNGDVLMSVDFLEPVNNLLTMGTKIAGTMEGDPDSNVWDYTLDTADALWRTMQEIPTMQTLKTVMDTVQYHKEDSALPVWAEIPIEVARGGATGFVPAPVRQTAQAMDPYYRDAYTSNALGQQTLDAVKNAFPGLRQTLPEKLDNFGQPKMQENQPLNALNAFLIPGSVRTYNQSEVSKELSKLSEATGSANVFPDRAAPYTLSSTAKANPFKVQLDGEQRQTYQETRGTITYSQTLAAMSNRIYQNADAEQRAEIATNIKNYANYVAKVQALASQGIEYSSDDYKKVISALEQGIDPATYYCVYSTYKKYDADGNNNMKQEEVQNALDNAYFGDDPERANQIRAIMFSLYNEKWKSNPYR